MIIDDVSFFGEGRIKQKTKRDAATLRKRHFWGSWKLCGGIFRKISEVRTKYAIDSYLKSEEEKYAELYGKCGNARNAGNAETFGPGGKHQIY